MVANIWIAASDNNIKVVEDYLNSGKFTPNSKDPNGYTPVHAAAAYGYIDLLKLLMAKGGDINIQDNDGDTPLHHCEDVNMAKVLIEEFKCDWNLQNHEGQSPLQYKEEDDELPELVSYLKAVKYGNSEPVDSSSLPVDPQVLGSLPSPGNVDGREINYSLQTENEQEVDQERRKQIEAIMQGEDSEEKLREYVSNIVHEGMSNWEEEQKGNKKRREE